MTEELSCNVSIITENMNGKIVYIARCEELGVSDFGDTIEEAIKNLRISLGLLIQHDPSKADFLKNI